MGNHMRVIRKFSQAKTGIDIDCEDLIVVTSDFIAVIDGVTSKASVRIKGRTLGKLSAELVRECIYSLKPTASAKEFINTVNDSFKQVIKEFNITNPLGATVAIYSNFLKEVWFIGDTQGIINGEYITNKSKIDKVTAEARSAFVQAQLAMGQSMESIQDMDTGREFILPLLSIEHIFANRDDSEFTYTVLNGSDSVIVKIVNVQGSEVILATDGYPEVKQSFGESEAILAKILKEDPLLIYKFKATKGLIKGNKSYDDRAYIKFCID